MTRRLDIAARLKLIAQRDAFAAPYAENDLVLLAQPSSQVHDAKR